MQAELKLFFAFSIESNKFYDRGINSDVRII